MAALMCVCTWLPAQEGICMTLDPDFHFLEVAYPYVARRLLTDEDPQLRERLFQVSTSAPAACLLWVCACARCAPSAGRP